MVRPEDGEIGPHASLTITRVLGSQCQINLKGTINKVKFG